MRLQRPQTRPFRSLTDVADWLLATCLGYGASLHTALYVAALFVEDPAVRDRFDPGWRERERVAREAAIPPGINRRSRRLHEG